MRVVVVTFPGNGNVWVQGDFKKWKRFPHYLLFPHKGSVMGSCSVFVVANSNRLLNKHSNRQWFETLWRPCDVTPMTFGLLLGHCLYHVFFFIMVNKIARRMAADLCPSASKAALMNMNKYYMWIHHERLHNHNKAKHNKTVCIFLGIYCMIHSYRSTNQ